MKPAADEPRVLMISFALFPRPGAGHVRTSKFAKYLPDFGWRPAVVTEKRGRGREDAGRGDGELAGARVIEVPFYDPFMRMKELLGLERSRDASAQVDELPAGTPLSRLRGRITRKAIRLAKDWLAFPDARITWLPFALLAAYRETRRRRYTLIYSTYPPGTNHLVAFALKKMTGLPWVADFRDLWSQDRFLDRSPARRRVERLLERMVIRRADAIIAVSEPYAEVLAELHRDRQITVITNGFDPDEHPAGVLPFRNRFVITYTGNLYGLRCDPRPVLSAVESLIDEGELEEGEILLRFYSQWDPAFERFRKEMRHKGILELCPLVPREEALQRQAESSALLLVLFDEPQADLWLPSKVYEYMGAGRPILYWGPAGGVVPELLARTRAGRAPAGVAELESVLREWIREFKRTGAVSIAPVEAEVDRYRRRELTGQLARVMESLSEKRC